MKSLSKLAVLQTAIASVAKKRTIVANTNGTMGMTLLCHFDRVEEVQNQEWLDLDKQRVREKLRPAPDVAKIKEIESKLEALPANQVMTIFKLETPIEELVGTKIITVNVGSVKGKSFNPRMQKVEYVYMPEDVRNGDYAMFEDTGKKVKNDAGQEVEVIKLHLSNSILDVVKEEIDRNGKVWKQARAYITNVSFRSMQVVGGMLAREQASIRSLWGAMDTKEYESIAL